MRATVSLWRVQTLIGAPLSDPDVVHVTISLNRGAWVDISGENIMLMALQGFKHAILKATLFCREQKEDEWTSTRAQQVATKHCLLIGCLFGKFMQSKYNMRRVIKSRTIRRTEQIGVAAALETCIPKVLGLNLGCRD